MSCSDAEQAADRTKLLDISIGTLKAAFGKQARGIRQSSATLAFKAADGFLDRESPTSL